MKLPAEIEALATRRYANKWRQWLTQLPPGLISFSLAPPTSDLLEHRTSEVDAWLRDWQSWTARHPLATLRVRKVVTSYGPQDVATHLDFGDIDALVSVDLATSAHWQRAKRRSERILADSLSPHRVWPYLAAIVEMSDADFQILSDAADWFRRNPRSGLLPRQVPVEGMHTKWLAKHRRLVLAILDSGVDPTITSYVPENATPELDPDELDALGLVAPPPMTDLILSDAHDRRHLDGLRHLRAPVPELAGLALNPSVVLIVENKESALIIPDTPGLVVVHSLGNHLNVLEQLPWLTDARTFYWGDLDRPGITLLSRARNILPKIRSVLMDAMTLTRFQHLAVPENLTRVDPPRSTLTAEEAEILARITGGHPDGGHLQLEQERLPQTYVLDALAKVDCLKLTEMVDTSGL